jgi:hypothetical protein
LKPDFGDDVISMQLRKTPPGCCANIVAASLTMSQVKATLIAHENATRSKASVTAFILATAIEGYLMQFVHFPHTNIAFVHDAMLRLGQLSDSLVDSLEFLETGTARATAQPGVQAVRQFVLEWLKENPYVAASS